jgi:hypothetical protein
VTSFSVTTLRVITSTVLVLSEAGWMASIAGSDIVNISCE